eukprot:3095864-Rhodomonas_salina.2
MQQDLCVVFHTAARVQRVAQRHHNGLIHRALHVAARGGPRGCHEPRDQRARQHLPIAALHVQAHHLRVPHQAVPCSQDGRQGAEEAAVREHLQDGHCRCCRLHTVFPPAQHAPGETPAAALLNSLRLFAVSTSTGPRPQEFEAEPIVMLLRRSVAREHDPDGPLCPHVEKRQHVFCVSCRKVFLHAAASKIRGLHPTSPERERVEQYGAVLLLVLCLVLACAHSEHAERDPHHLRPRHSGPPVRERIPLHLRGSAQSQLLGNFSQTP